MARADRHVSARCIRTANIETHKAVGSTNLASGCHVPTPERILEASPGSAHQTVSASPVAELPGCSVPSAVSSGAASCSLARCVSGCGGIWDCSQSHARAAGPAPAASGTFSPGSQREALACARKPEPPEQALLEDQGSQLQGFAKRAASVGHGKPERCQHGRPCETTGRARQGPHFGGFGLLCRISGGRLELQSDGQQLLVFARMSWQRSRWPALAPQLTSPVCSQIVGSHCALASSQAIYGVPRFDAAQSLRPAVSMASVVL